MKWQEFFYTDLLGKWMQSSMQHWWKSIASFVMFSFLVQLSVPMQEILVYSILDIFQFKLVNVMKYNTVEL
jgi:hypothetical protein